MLRPTGRDGTVVTCTHMPLVKLPHLRTQTSMLVNALSENSIYCTAHYSRATRGHHVVVTGHLTAASAGRVAGI